MPPIMLGDHVAANIPLSNRRAVAVPNYLNRAAQRWIGLIPDIAQEWLAM
jgi:hypothetical protein